MSEKISTIILSAQQRLKELLSLYLSEAEGFELLEDYSDFSDSDISGRLAFNQ